MALRPDLRPGVQSQACYFHLDLGVGYTHGEGNLRIEAFANNVTGEAHGTQATIDTGAQEFVFNPPRTYGLRMRVNF
ncbi:MAG: hypothetical protein ACREXP_04555 [Steroidobacteraceae bacterium]